MQPDPDLCVDKYDEEHPEHDSPDGSECVRCGAEVFDD